MSEQTPKAVNWMKWFDPRSRGVGMWAFIINRLSGLGLVLYLVLHLIMLGKLAKGPQAYDQFIAMMKTPFWIAGELLVVAAVFIHGLNGVRIILTSFGIGGDRQKQLFLIIMLVAGAAVIFFAWKMFAHAGGG
jgi:succinate dehydrogenase / fumarate reductase cytochrome b subunit